MSKPCQGRDEALLMLAHGQLTGWQALIVRSHAARCPDCRARLKRYGALSGALASALASPAGPRLLPALSVKFIVTRSLYFGIILAGLIATLWTIHSVAGANETVQPPPVGEPCRSEKGAPTNSLQIAAEAPTSVTKPATKMVKP